MEWRADSGAVELGHQLPDRVLPVTGERPRALPQPLRRRPAPDGGPDPLRGDQGPFEGATLDPDGQLWLTKSRAIGDSLRYYQVVDRTGALVREVTHRGLGHVLAISPTDLLVAEPIEHGVRLLRFRLNPPAPAGAATP
ncbi:MAG: hypothetical protein IPJ95_04450 [Gemmatimonadetes bacterium]|nr:hypothetical protein [Gemmatimonadota bacterium]